MDRTRRHLGACAPAGRRRARHGVPACRPDASQAGDVRRLPRRDRRPECARLSQPRADRCLGHVQRRAARRCRPSRNGPGSFAPLSRKCRSSTCCRCARTPRRSPRPSTTTATRTIPRTRRYFTVFAGVHNVRTGVRYPAVLYQMRVADISCPPWHSRKMIAALKDANAAGTRLLLRVREGAGHNLMTSEMLALRDIDELTFFCDELIG
ncbi:MAG: prolyl oligopeptidase family serine peptidase [Rubrivivax sp.]